MSESEPKPGIDEKLRATAHDNRITCARALRFANDNGLTPAETGARIDTLGIKIADCQLGCFGHSKKNI